MPSFKWEDYNLGVNGTTAKRTNRTCPNCGQDDIRLPCDRSN